MDPNGAQGIIDGLIPHSNFGNYSDFGCEMGTIDFYDHIEFVGDRDNAINSYPLVTPSFGTWMEESFKWFFCTFKNSNVNENFRAIYFKYVAESNEIKIELNIRTRGLGSNGTENRFKRIATFF